MQNGPYELYRRVLANRLHLESRYGVGGESDLLLTHFSRQECEKYLYPRVRERPFLALAFYSLSRPGDKP